MMPRSDPTVYARISGIWPGRATSAARTTSTSAAVTPGFQVRQATWRIIGVSLQPRGRAPVDRDRGAGEEPGALGAHERADRAEGGGFPDRPRRDARGDGVAAPQETEPRGVVGPRLPRVDREPVAR